MVQSAHATFVHQEHAGLMLLHHANAWLHLQVPHIVNGSMMLGAILMFGIILPIAKTHEGDWYPKMSELSSSKDVRGPYAYQVPSACLAPLLLVLTCSTELQHAAALDLHSTARCASAGCRAHVHKCQLSRTQKPCDGQSSSTAHCKCSQLLLQLWQHAHLVFANRSLAALGYSWARAHTPFSRWGP